MIRRSKSCKRSLQLVSTLQSLFFRVHGIDAKGDVIIRRQLKRRYVLTARPDD